MGRVIIASLVGGVILFALGFLSWAILPWHGQTMPPLLNDDVITALKEHMPGSGTYYFPGLPEVPEGGDVQAAWDEWGEKHEQGPVGKIIYYADGLPPMPPSTYGYGMAFTIFSAFLTAWLVYVARSSLTSFFCRVAFVTGIGVVIAVAAELRNWNWLSYHTDYTLVMIADDVVSWFILGLLIAALIRPDRKPEIEPAAAA